MQNMPKKLHRKDKKRPVNAVNEAMLVNDVTAMNLVDAMNAVNQMMQGYQ